MAASVQDTMDDLSFYVGEDDFQASFSVCDSDISETDSEADDGDDGAWRSDEERRAGATQSRASKCLTKSFSMDTGLTAACSYETDTVEGSASQITEEACGPTVLERTLRRLEAETHRVVKYSKEWCHLMEEMLALSLLLRDCAEDDDASLSREEGEGASLPTVSSESRRPGDARAPPRESPRAK